MEEKTGIKQQAISRLENPFYGKATLTTLKRIAAAFDVGLLVEFVPFSQLINRVSGTPYTERGFSPETMNVPNFDDEETRGAFAPQSGLPVPKQNAQLGSAPHGMDDIVGYGTAAEPPFELPRPQTVAPIPFIPLQGTSGLSPQDQISMGGGTR